MKTIKEFDVRTKPRVTLPMLVGHDSDYADLWIFVRTTTDEWKFPVSLVWDSGYIYDGDPEYAQDHNACFEEAAGRPPEPIYLAYMAMRPAAVRLLENLTRPKD